MGSKVGASRTFSDSLIRAATFAAPLVPVERGLALGLLVLAQTPTITRIVILGVVTVGLLHL